MKVYDLCIYWSKETWKIERYKKIKELNLHDNGFLNCYCCY